MAWFNYTDPLGVVINYLTINITGSEFMTYTLILFMAILFLFVARVPFEVQVITISPFILVLGAYDGSLIVFAGLMSLYLAFIFIQFLLSKV